MLKIHLTSMLMLAVIIPTGVRSQPSSSIPPPLDDPEAYKVYAALLPEEWPVQAAHAKTLVFREDTVKNPNCLPSGKPLETDWLPVLKDFTSANTIPKLLRAGFDLGVPYIVVPFADIRLALNSPSTSRSPAWGSFYDKYPDSGGFMAVSAVGFDATKQRAIVYMEHSCGGLCGGGTDHFLEKVAGVWRHARLADVKRCVWIS